MQQSSNFKWSFTPALNESLPHVFDSGLKFNGVLGYCFKCETEFSSREIRGKIIPKNGYECTLQAKAFCLKCNALTHFNYRITGIDEIVIDNIPKKSEESELIAK